MITEEEYSNEEKDENLGSAGEQKKKKPKEKIGFRDRKVCN